MLSFTSIRLDVNGDFCQKNSAHGKQSITTSQTMDCGAIVRLVGEFRRLTIDYEYLAETAEAMVQLAFIQIMLIKFFQ